MFQSSASENDCWFYAEDDNSYIAFQSEDECNNWIRRRNILGYSAHRWEPQAGKIHVSGWTHEFIAEICQNYYLSDEPHGLMRPLNSSQELS